MAGLATEGFRAQLPDTPVIPANIGRVDPQAIYDSVVKGLSTANTLRVEGARQQQEDATRALATQTAQADSAVLPKKTTLALAGIDNDLLAEQNRRTQLRTLGGLTGAQQIVAAKNGFPLATTQTTERLANGDVKTNKNVLATVGGEDVKVSTDTSTGPFALMPGIPSDLRAFLAGTANMTPEQRDQALLVKYGLQARPSGAAIQYKEVVGGDGITRLVAVDPRAVGAQVIGSGETYGTGVGAAKPGASASAPVPENAQVFASPTIGQAEAAKESAKATEKLKVDRQAAFPKAQKAVADWDQNAKNVLSILDDAKLALGGEILGPDGKPAPRNLDQSGGVIQAISRRLASKVPGTTEYNVAKALDTLRANIGFDRLAAMRTASPTGGALGNVSDKDLEALQNSIANLDLGQDLSVIIANINAIKSRYQELTKNIHDSFESEYKDSISSGLPGVPFTQGGALIQPNAATRVVAPTPQDAAAIEFARANPNDPRSAAILKANGL